MKSYLPLLSLALVFASCSTAYQTGQTPDDVYFSPERQREEYVRVEKKDDRQYQKTRYQSDEEVREDRYLRMKTSYRRYSVLDDYDCYSYNPSSYYSYNTYYRNNNYTYYNTTWNPHLGSYNSYYYNPYYSSPYYSGYVPGNVNPVYNKPRGSNLNVYNGNGTNSNSYSPSKGRTFENNSSNNNNNYQGSGTNAGGFLRNVFGGSSSSSSSNSSNTSSSTNSSSTPSSSSSSSSSGTTSAPARKF